MPRSVTRLFPRCLFLAALLPVWALAQPINKTFFGGVAIKGYDPVAYCTEQAARKGSKEHTVAWHDAEWRFATEANRAAFAADPERYAPAYGGFCAFAMAHGDTVGIDPEAWTIVDGRLFLNYSMKIREQWSANREQLIEQADQHWQSLRDD